MRRRVLRNREPGAVRNVAKLQDEVLLPARPLTILEGCRHDRPELRVKLAREPRGRLAVLRAQHARNEVPYGAPVPAEHPSPRAPLVIRGPECAQKLLSSGEVPRGEIVDRQTTSPA